jgi:hypothetical protein
MPAFTQFVAVSDEAEVLDSYTAPDGLSGWGELRVYPRIDFPDLNPNGKAILAFRLNVSGWVKLWIGFAKPEHWSYPYYIEKFIINYNFDPPEPAATRPRSWHEVFPCSLLRPENQALIVWTSGDGSLSISDVVIFYDAITD